MFRVYDKKKKKWVTDNVYLTPDGELVESKKSIFGGKLMFTTEDRYVFQQAIDLYDKNNKQIFIGDYLEAKVSNDRIVRGVVTFAQELSAFIIVCFDSDEYFTLGTDVCELIMIVGNVFDGFIDVKKEKKRDKKRNKYEDQ